jgi:hypothetical protein
MTGVVVALPDELLILGVAGRHQTRPEGMRNHAYSIRTTRLRRITEAPPTDESV